MKISANEYTASILNEDETALGITNISIPGGHKSIGILEPESEEVNQHIVYGKPNRLPESNI